MLPNSRKVEPRPIAFREMMLFSAEAVSRGGSGLSRVLQDRVREREVNRPRVALAGRSMSCCVAVAFFTTGLARLRRTHLYIHPITCPMM
jgi:hypothetical protein